MAQVCIDSGSTHKFTSEELVQKVSLQPNNKGRSEVMVVSGEKTSSFKYGVPIFVDLYLLPLQGYGIILGT